MFVVALCVLGVLASVILSGLALSRSSRDANTATSGQIEATGAQSEEAAQVDAVLSAIGLDAITVSDRDGIIVLGGPVADDAEAVEAIAAAEAIVGAGRVDASGLITVGATDADAPGHAANGTSSDDPSGGAASAADGGAGLSAERAAALQNEIDRLIAVNPLIYETAQAEPTTIQQVVLNNVAAAMQGYPELEVTVVGHTDGQGSDENNMALSLRRANGVREYLIGQGVDPARLVVEARGEETSTGAEVLAGLERRVDFEVGGAVGSLLAPNDSQLRIALVAPSASNDLAFTQSMVDALTKIRDERGNVELAITDSTFVPADAAAAVRGYAEQDYDLVVAHGVEFGADLIAMVEEFPDVTFAWGTAEETFGLPNLYAYDAAAEEGGYVMGAMAAMLSDSNVVGVVGPIEVGDAKRYVNGFEAGARSQSPRPRVDVEYTGSFGDIALAASTAERHLDAGADVLTGTAEMVVGAVAVAETRDALWFGTQANQTALAPDNVVASQVYRWEVVLRPIVSDVDNGIASGRGLVADMANGGLVIEMNPGFDLPADVRQEADRLSGLIRNGGLSVPVG